MHRYLKTFLTGFVIFWLPLMAFAQPTLLLSDATVPSESITSIEVSVMDFTDITRAQFSLNWDPNELEFVSIQNINPNADLNLNPTNFDDADAANGSLVFSWEDLTGVGITVADGMTFFGIEFRALIPEGATAPVVFSNNPTPIIINRNASGDTNIFDPDFVRDGNITAEQAIPDVFFSLIPQEEKDIFCQGDQICYDLEVAGFDSILSVQVALNWKGTVLEFDRVENFGLARLENSFNVETDENSPDLVTRANTLGLVETLDEFDTGISLPDGTSLYTICFNVVGEPDSSTVLAIADPPSTEVVHFREFELDIIPSFPTITVTNCEDLVGFSANCTDAIQGDTICIGVTTTNFTNINEAAFDMVFNTDVLSFINTQNFNLPGLSADNFNPTLGSLVLDWTDPGNNGETVDDNTLLFEACFLVVGDLDSEGFVNFIDQPESFRIVNTASERLENVQFDNCESIRVLPPPVEVSALDLSAPPNEEICVPIVVDQFTNIAHIEMPIEWDPTVLAFSTINSSLPGLGLVNFDVSATDEGRLQLISWDSPDAGGITFTEETTIFEICFNAIGTLGSLSPISFPSTEANPVFIRNANNQETGATITNGSVTIASSGMVLSSPSLELVRGESFCIDISVSNFNEIISMDYTHTWDATVLRFDSVGGIPFQEMDLTDIVQNGEGSLGVSWSSLSGATLLDGSVLYTLCFTAIGDLGNCSNFNLGDFQEVTTIPSQGENIGIFNNINDICIDNFGLTNVVVESPSCENSDGSIRLDISGDEGNTYVYLVSRDGEEFINNADTRDSIRLDNLEEGEYCLSVLTINTGESLNECFQVRIEDSEIPIPMAGEDIDLGCQDLTNLALQLDADVIVGGVFSYAWAALDGGVIRAGDETIEDPTVTAAGTYILTVSTTKCAASDTVVVFASTPPLINLEPAGFLGCTNNTLELSAINSPIEDSYRILWTTADGNIVSGENTLTPTVDQEGVYVINITDTLNNCASTADAFVLTDTIKPRANAGIDRQLGCEDDFITILGEGSSAGTGIRYQWTTPDGSSIVNPDQIGADISRVGTYVLTVTNIINGCEANDTMRVIADESLPVARANPEAFIGCDQEDVILDGTQSSQGISFTYQWLSPDNQQISEEMAITTTEEGQYVLIVTNIDNDDCISDSAFVQVTIDRTPPESSITQQLTLDCKSECTDLSANVPAGDHFIYQWSTNDGLICEGENTPTAQVSAIALYQFTIINTLNNCADTSSTIVSGDGTSIISDPGPSREIGCLAEPVTLDGSGSTINANSQITWTNEMGDIIATEIATEVTEPGEYTLTIVDEVAGCNASNRVTVSLNMELPLANAGEDIQLEGCTFPNNLRLNGGLSESGPNISYAWFAPGGGQLVGDTTVTSPQITSLGIYELTVTNNTNGCSSTDRVQITSDVVIPVSNAGPDRLLDCNAPTIMLAGISEAPSPNSIIQWTTTDGNIVGINNTLSVEIDAGGTYILNITSEDGCSASDEVIVTADLDIPAANAGVTQNITCNESIILNGSGSTGENLQVQWTTSNGNIVSGATSYSPEINLGGIYTLTVTNIDNNCQASSEVFVSADEELPLAMAGEDQEVCTNEAQLSANSLSANITGSWTTLEGSLILSETEAVSGIADLAEGVNTYIWTLSTDACPSYSSDTVLVTVPTFPVANDDAFEIAPDQSFGVLDVAANDQINGQNYNVNILEQPNVGTLNQTNPGVFEFTTPARYFGTQQFQYEICSTTCSELCDIATVRVVVIPGADVDTTNSLPNAITPNGDGLNDRLLFDELIFDGVDFPQSELVVFNRWGDIVYRVSPYNNDWEGKNDNGDDLPEGTYYFVLRLDVADGESMKGDITILR